MPRLPRVEVEGAIYLVHARGEAANPLFQDPQDYDTYLKLLAEGQGRHGFRLFAYCLLPDAVLLAMEPSAGSTLSEIMHDLTAAYSRYANRRHGRTGPLFCERFKHTLVESETHLLPLTTYLHLLPVQLGLAQEAQGYPFSSCQRYCAPTSTPDRLDMDAEIQEVLRALAADTPEISYVQHLARISPKEQQELQELFASRIVGSAAFMSRVKEELAARSRPAPNMGTVLFSAQKKLEPSPILLSTARGAGWRPVGIVMASLAAVMFSAVVVASLHTQVSNLKQALVAMAEEGGRFRTGYSLAVQRKGSEEMAGLEGSEWAIRLMPMRAQSPEAMSKDALVFTARHVTSQTLGKDGFAPSRYTVTLQPDGTMNWETMQVNPSGETVSWQGQWQGPVMQGVLTRQPAAGAPEHFTFVGASKKPTAARSET